MNKTFTINLANQIFNINDDAYETLLAYFSSLEKFYANEEGKEDIITDIKARFAELFFEKGKNYIITKEDAEQVINTDRNSCRNYKKPKPLDNRITNANKWNNI